MSTEPVLLEFHTTDEAAHGAAHGAAHAAAHAASYASPNHGAQIAVLTFNRPEARNALNLEAMRLFASHIDTLAAMPDLRALIVTGAGDTAFCSGGDLVELSQRPDEVFALDFITLMGDALLKMERLPVPVIGAINGYALGGGSEIAMACDLRVVDENVRLGFVQIRLALTPGWGAGQRLLRHVGYARAMELLLEGRILHADDLVQLGLANHVVEHGQSLRFALHVARKTAEHSGDTVRGVKALLQAGLNRPYEDALRFEREVFPPLWAADAHLHAQDLVLKSINDKKTDRTNP